ncbi:MAG: hypothetical protein ABI316_05770 [Casimicrobiaceae bacterium]
MSARTRIVALLTCGGIGALAPVVGAASLMVVANLNTPPLDQDTLQKIYLGKVVEVDGQPVTPVNLAKGNSLRKAFMEQYLTEEDDKFVAYWTVRRYIGKGTPPREFATIEQQLEFLRATPGAIGYVDNNTDVHEGLRTLLTKP